MPLFILFFVVPLIEISLFIAVGEQIGIVSTLLLCLLTAVAGVLILRAQGLRTWLDAQASLRQGRLPVDELYTGFCLVVAGAFLMTPGFFTDTIGFLLLMPPFRDALRRRAKPYLKARGRIYSEQDETPRHYKETRYTVIDAEFKDVTNDNNNDS